jgi:hypothetical protein
MAGRNQPNKRKSLSIEQQLAKRLQRVSILGNRVQKSYTPPNRSRLNKEIRGSNPQAQAASAYASAQRSALPVINSSQNTSRVVHRELIANIVGSGAFSVPFSFPLNPGMSQTFPWLSVIAQQWEQYRFNSLRFCYYTRTGTQTVGSLQLIADYDAADSAPISEFVASSYQDVVEDAPWKDIHCELMPSSLHAMGPKKYIRTGPLAPNLDIKTYDCGTMFIGTTDASGTPPWGKLWVEYDVTFSVPQLSNGGLSNYFHATSSGPNSGFILPSPTVLSGTLPVSVLGEVITFPTPGVYLVTYSAATETSLELITVGSLVAGGGAALDPSFGSGGTGYNTSGSGTSSITQNAIIQTYANNQTLTFSNVFVDGGGGFSELVVSLLPSGAL